MRKKECQFRTQCDTEVILAQYRCFGSGGFQAFNGMWAFALVDLEKRQVILSRDRFSEKPLYYCRNGSCLYFASEIKQLLPFVASVEVNRRTLIHYLDQGLIDAGEETFFRGIRQLRAKHNLLISLPSGEMREEGYWDYTIREERRPIEETMQEFDRLLTDSTRLRLRSDVTVATLLSGGLDSSTIATIGNEFARGNLVCYSVVAEERKYSETPFIEALVNAHGIPARQFTFKVSDVFDCLDDVLYYNDEPPGGLSAVAHYMMMKVIKQETDATVLLNGQGGDELLLGYRKFYFFYLLDLLRQFRLLRSSWEVLGSLFFSNRAPAI